MCYFYLYMYSQPGMLTLSYAAICLFLRTAATTIASEDYIAQRYYVTRCGPARGTGAAGCLPRMTSAVRRCPGRAGQRALRSHTALFRHRRAGQRTGLASARR